MSDQTSLTGVVNGCAVTAQASPDMTVHVADGRTVYDNVVSDVVADDLTITTADTVADRLDSVVADPAGALSVLDGPVSDGINVQPADPAGYVLLAYIYVFNQAHSDYTGTIVTEAITDERDFVVLTDVQTFDADGQWMPPDWAKFCQVTLYGGGGGAGGGARSASTAGAGGGGGGGAECRTKVFSIADLTVPVDVTIGAGGDGGAGKTGSAGAGADGVDGNASGFGTWPPVIDTYLVANGGSPGLADGTGGDGGGSYFAAEPGTGYLGGKGAQVGSTTPSSFWHGTGWPAQDGGGGGGAASEGTDTRPGGRGGSSLEGGTGGGGGASIASTDGGDGGVPGPFFVAADDENNHGTSSTPNATAGSDGNSMRGGTGGGGGGVATGTGGNGGTGGLAGGGGGGGAGGGGANQDGGNGGTGGNGLCIITSW